MQDNKNFNMPDTLIINKLIFTTHLLAFVKQSIKGSIMAIYKHYYPDIKTVIDIIRDGNLVLENNIKYINNSWTSYHEKSDNYVIEKINFIIKHGDFIHESCLFNFLFSFTKTVLFYVLARIDNNELKDEEFLNISIDNIMDAILSFHVDNLMQSKSSCNDDEICKPYVYKKGEDLIKIAKKI